MLTLRLGLAGVLSLLLFACGGKVVVDAGGSGEGGTGGTGSTSSASSSSSSGSGAGGQSAEAICQAACDKLESIPMCSQSGTCTQDCLDAFNMAGDCQSLFLDAVACIIDNAGVGGVCTGQPCESLGQAYSDCVQGSTGNCTSGMCSGGPDGSCECSGSCNDGSNVKVVCFAQPNGATCLCNKNGQDIGKCEALPGSDFACDIKGGCCAAFF